MSRKREEEGETPQEKRKPLYPFRERRKAGSSHSGIFVVLEHHWSFVKSDPWFRVTGADYGAKQVRRERLWGSPDILHGANEKLTYDQATKLAKDLQAKWKEEHTEI